MANSKTEPLIRMRTPADTVAVIPHLVGFTPQRSLVVISMRPPKGRVGLTLRYDLPPDRHDKDIAKDVSTRLAHDGAATTMIVCYPEDELGAEELPRSELIKELRCVLDLRGIDVVDALCVVDGRYRSYFCDNRDCCPLDGTPVDPMNQQPALALAAEHALKGEVVLPDREALAASIAPVTFLARRAMEQALDRAEVEMTALLLDEGVEAVRKHTTALVSELLLRYADPSVAEMSDDEAAWVVLGLSDVLARDDVLIDAATHGDPVVGDGLTDEDAGHENDVAGPPLHVFLALFIELARRALPPDDAPTCTVLAWLAYVRGNGGLANIALDRAFASDPHYSMAGIIEEAMARQLPPSKLRGAMKEAGEQMRDWGSD